jgi:hypothetical protein
MTTSHKRHSADYWQEQITLWQASGLSQKVFCQQNRLALSTFQRWKKQFTGDESSVPDVSDFIELPLSGDASQDKTAWDIELSLGGGITLRLRQG